MPTLQTISWQIPLLGSYNTQCGIFVMIRSAYLIPTSRQLVHQVIHTMILAAKLDLQTLTSIRLRSGLSQQTWY